MKSYVHYRIGSLEIYVGGTEDNKQVHYRIGSLEKKYHRVFFEVLVHYRIGSLESLALLLVLFL